MNHLGVFAKYWQPGTVKTRLAASIGSENAAALYREFVNQTLSRHAQTGHSRSVWVWPPEKRGEFSYISGDNWSVEQQATGDLGFKMLDFFRRTLDASTNDVPDKKAVLIGTDSPDLPGDIIAQAFAELEHSRCVLGPSDDGGYYLIGLSEVVPAIFSDIQWSSPQVLAQTIQQLDSVQASWSQLPVWSDIDEFDDLQRLESKLADQGERTPDDQQLLDAIRQFGSRTS